MKNETGDDFLLRLRADPSKKFLSTLKADLDRQTTTQARARRTLFRTAILAALIGGSAVAVAFALLRGSPARTLVRMVAIGPAQTAASKPAAERSGGGAPRTIGLPAQGDVPPVSVIPGMLGAPTEAAAQQSRGAFVVAGPTAIILNSQDIARRWLPTAGDKQPQFQLTSSSEALALLCHAHQGTAAAAGTTDIAGASRRILPSELETCKLNGVTHIAEIHSGYEAVVLARSKLYGSPRLSARAIFLALAAEVPDPNRPQSLIKNPYRTWSAVDSALLEERIEVLGPPMSSATAAAFRQTLMEAGCASFPWLAALKQMDSERYEKVCRTLRDDGVYRERGEKLREHLETYPNALALFDFREVAAQPEELAAASIDGVAPSNDTVVAETYPGSRAMFLYINTARVASSPGMWAFIDAYRRSVEESWSIATLVAPQRQSNARKYLTPLQEMKF
jgi:phosphate transport system substrate-binding protein